MIELMENYKRLLKELPAPPKGKTGWPWDIETDPAVYARLKKFSVISIVTPSFNQGEYIEQTIRSVLLQNYPAMEYIIIDGGSNDNTIEIIKKYERWLKHWESTPDNGQSDAINKGIKICSGEIFNWLNSDDYYYQNCFFHLTQSFSSEKIYATAGSYRFFDEENEKKEKIIGLRLKPSVEESIAFVLMDQPSTFFRLQIIKQLGGLDNRLKFVMDQDIWKKYLLRYGMENIKVTKKNLTNFRLHGESKTSRNEFSEEYHGIFYSIALKLKLDKQAELIADEFALNKNSGYDFKFEFREHDRIIAAKAINYLIYFLGRKHFTLGNHKKSAEFFSSTDAGMLKKKHREELRKLKVKLKLIKIGLSSLIKKPLKAASA